jgi:hypothetical protein
VDLVDSLEPLCEVMAALVLEQDHRAFERDEDVTRRIAHGEELHVASVRRVADVDRIDEDARAHVPSLHLRTQPSEAAPPEAGKVGLHELRGMGFGHCRRQ